MSKENREHEKHEREREKHEREKHEREKHEHGRHEHERRTDRHREESGDDPRRHARIINRRWLGSPPPTAERYALAIQQWHALPGAVLWPATDGSGAPETPTPRDNETNPTPTEEENEP